MCAMCGDKPKTYRFICIEGERKGDVATMCTHEYNARMLDENAAWALIQGQEVAVPEWAARRGR